MTKWIVSSLVLLGACGKSATNNELVGQVKKVTDETPLICGDYVEADISLGVMRNGVGSMSKEDIDVYVQNEADVVTLKRAAETGELVKVTYDRMRWPHGLCVPTTWAISVAVVAEAK